MAAIRQTVDVPILVRGSDLTAAVESNPKPEVLPEAVGALLIAQALFDVRLDVCLGVVH